jgi:hypothetical protein
LRYHVANVPIAAVILPRVVGVFGYGANVQLNPYPFVSWKGSFSHSIITVSSFRPLINTLSFFYNEKKERVKRVSLELVG